MINLLCLYGLGLLHSGFAGYREATGRNLLIEKRRYYQRAVLRGLVAGQVAATIIFGVLLVMYSSAADPVALLATLGRAGRSALCVYVPYTTIVLAAFIPYLLPSLESRTLTIVAVFGPLTLLLPVVILVGAAAAVISVPTAEVAILFAVSIAAISAVEPVLAAGKWSSTT